MKYNPIRRKFYQMRRVLVETLGLPRQAIRPTSTFAELIPRAERRRLWQRFRDGGVELPPLMMNGSQCMLVLAVPLAWIALGLWMELSVCFVLPMALPVLIAAGWIGSGWANDSYADYTLGDAALATTTIDDCNVGGYRFTRNEILHKIRMVLSCACAVEPSEITPETKFMDLVDC